MKLVLILFETKSLKKTNSLSGFLKDFLKEILIFKKIYGISLKFANLKTLYHMYISRLDIHNSECIPGSNQKEMPISMSSCH